MTNDHRHSSKSCSIKVSQEGELLRVEIKDLGRGIPESKLRTLSSCGGVGLRGVQERIRQLGGTIEIGSSSSGRVVIATFRIPKEAQRSKEDAS